jgi:hypothetical protein
MSPTMLRASSLAPAFAVLLGCAAHNVPQSPAADIDKGRERLMLALRSARVFDPARLVAHVSHTCSLTIDGQPYPVVDLEELVPGATTPRGVNAILVLAPTLQVAQRLEYTRERPLFCAGNKLYVWGDLHVDDQPSEGNELSFGPDGGLVSLRHVEANEVPAPPAR